METLITALREIEALIIEPFMLEVQPGDAIGEIQVSMLLELRRGTSLTRLFGLFDRVLDLHIKGKGHEGGGVGLTLSATLPAEKVGLERYGRYDLKAVTG